MDDVYYIRSTYTNKQKDAKKNISKNFYDGSLTSNKSDKEKISKIKKFAKPIKDFFVDFCNETSIHGFNHIVAPERHLLEKYKIIYKICFIFIT